MKECPDWNAGSSLNFEKASGMERIRIAWKSGDGVYTE
ncbi:hypothetical protein LEP1GSC061_1318 [Leptospira wolffii serovar Khorat str. Khorat-H2]|nr:hypothetical protein LEP1GSC061_1318 [Leptospira wolffii serovar Khorat str. Khorat-H2]